MNKVILIAILTLAQSKFSFGQYTDCGKAVTQLQNYAAQVNQIYQYEYWTAIPNQRCPAFDAWGRPFNPQVVQNCRWQTLTYLNQWYGQQSNLVNNWYIQIMQGCSTNPQRTPSDGPAPRQKSGGDENEQIDTEQIEDLTAGIDEDKAVRISIPKTASGFKPR